MNPIKVHIVSLGCPKNLVDSEVMTAGLIKAGYVMTPHEEEAEVVLINTCAFILPAKEESIAEILRLAELKQTGACRQLIVTGCLPQRYQGELATALPEVDLFLGTGDAGRIVAHLKKLRSGGTTALPAIAEPTFLMTATHDRMLATLPHTAFLKIAEGCSNRCTYCIIPTVRGSYRSRRPPDILKEAEALAARGVKELILIAQDTTAYGSDLKGRPTLAALMRSLAGIDGLQWIRLLYTHPESLSDAVLEAMAAEPKICRYIDFPVQHIDDEILRAMNRRVGSRDILAKIRRAREIMPDVALRTSLIVGFPGETPGRFQKLVDFVRNVRFDHLGVFTYSREEGTPAALLPRQVSEGVKQTRRDLLMAEQAEISFEINRGLIGTTQEMIVEAVSETPGYLLARCRRQAPEIDGVTLLRRTPRARPGEILMGRIVAAEDYDLVAELAKQRR